jgi:hypothetical protein
MNTDGSKARELDLSKALNFLEHDKELLLALVKAYTLTATRQRKDLLDAVATGKYAKARNIMHRLLPILKILGSNTIVSSAEWLQEALKRNEVTPDVTGADGFLSRLDKLNLEVSDVPVRLHQLDRSVDWGAPQIGHYSYSRGAAHSENGFPWHAYHR